MLAEAPNLGCPLKNGQPDAICLCSNVDFSYGIRDCVAESCPSDADKTSIIKFGLAYCNNGKHSGHDAIMTNSSRKLILPPPRQPLPVLLLPLPRPARAPPSRPRLNSP